MSKSASVRWAFWVWWVLASTFGWATGFPVGAVVFGTTGIGGTTRGSLAPAVSFAGVGAVSGILQWLILRRHLPQAGWWAVGSTLGGALAGIAGDVGTPPVGFAVVGTVVGTVQWLVLRRYVARAGWWIAASTVSWTAAFPVVDTITSPVVRAVDTSVILPVSETVSEMVDLAALFGLMGGVPEVIRGAVMAWLMRQPAPRSSPAPRLWCGQPW